MPLSCTQRLYAESYVNVTYGMCVWKAGEKGENELSLARSVDEPKLREKHDEVCLSASESLSLLGCSLDTHTRKLVEYTNNSFKFHDAQNFLLDIKFMELTLFDKTKLGRSKTM